MSSSDSNPSPPSGSTSASISSTTSSSFATSGNRSESSPPSTASKKIKLDENSMTIELDKFLECTICLDFPSSPIHSCDNGHVLCGQCAPKFVACPTCQLPKLSACPLGEKLAKESNKKMDCVNLEAGCKEGVLSTKFVDHLSRCYFREIICGEINYNYNVSCGMKVQFHEYTQHLEDAHKEKIRLGPTLTKTYFHDEKRFTQYGISCNWLQWGQAVIKFRSNQFIIHAKVSRQSQLFFSWVSVLGDKDVADKFICKIKFQNKTSNKLGCSWKLKVLAFHETNDKFPTNLSETQFFEYSEQCSALSVPMDAIRKWGQLGADQILAFGVRYEIKEA